MLLARLLKVTGTEAPAPRAAPASQLILP